MYLTRPNHPARCSTLRSAMSLNNSARDDDRAASRAMENATDRRTQCLEEHYCNLKGIRPKESGYQLIIDRQVSIIGDSMAYVVHDDRHLHDI